MYQKQLLSLQKVLASLGTAFQIEEVDSETLAYFPCENLRKAIALYGYPSSFYMDTCCEGFSFYGINEINAGQEGYDLIDEYLVIANVSCDPIVVNKKGLMSWSPHGGAWEFRNMAEDMAQFFLMIETFALLYFWKYQTHIYDEDFNLIVEKYRYIRDKLTGITKSDAMADEFLKCMLYL